jgi:hypothetical protein
MWPAGCMLRSSDIKGEGQSGEMRGRRGTKREADGEREGERREREKGERGRKERECV